MSRIQIFEGAAAPTYLLEENFNGIGYENTWVESAAGGTVDEDYTTTILEGTHSLNMVESTAAVTAYSDHASNGTTYYFFKIRFNVLPTGSYFLFRGRTGATSRVGIFMTSSGTLGCWSTGTTYTVDAVTTGVTYDIWVDYVPSGTCSVGFAASGGAKPTSGNKYATQAAAFSDNVDRFMLEANNSADIIVDRVLVDDAVIGQAP
jgi:hypothetical protein